MYAALGLGLVVTFRSSGVLNFAVGAQALFAAYMYAFLREGQLFSPIPGTPNFLDLGDDLGLALSLVLAVLISVLLSLVIYGLVFRPLRHAPPVASAVASIGLMVLLQAVMAQRVGTRPVNVGAIFPRDIAQVNGAPIQLDRVWFAGAVVVLGFSLAALFRFTKFGLRTRAAATSELGAFVSGLSPDRIAAANWAITGAVVGLAGVLIAPIAPLVPVSYTLFVIPALAAALVGQFRAIAPTAVGGIVLGMLQSEVTFLQIRYNWLPKWIVPSSGLPEVLPLLLILIVLLVRSQPLTSRGVELRESLSAAPRPDRIWLPALVGLVSGTTAIMLLSSPWRLALITSMATAIIALSMVLVTGYGGQISLAQLTLAGTAGFFLSTLSDGFGIPFPIAPLLAACGSAIIGVIIGLPALRVRGLSLGVVTLALAVAIEAVWFRNNDFNGGSGGARVQDPSLFGLDLSVGVGLDFPSEAFAFLCLVVLIAVAVGVALIRRSRFGSTLMAVRVNERAAAAAGIDVVRTKLTVFALGSFVAGLGGSLITYRQGLASFDLFPTLLGLGLFATVYLSGITSISGGVLAGFLAINGIVFKATDEFIGLGNWYNAITGALLVLTIITYPNGLVGPIHEARRRRGRREQDALATDEPAIDTVHDAPIGRPTMSGGSPLLSLDKLTVRYGNVYANSDVSLDLNPGSIMGLIGPNGAGKSTLLDAVTGFADYSGSVDAFGASIDGLQPHQRIRRGVARTFQSSQLCDELTVRENVEIGRLSDDPADTDEAIRLAGLEHLVDRFVADLSQGQRQLVALGRALASKPAVLLLDEPAGGLDSNESEALGERLRFIRDNGVAILLIDHDMGLIMGVCDEVVVLDFGEVIAYGPADEVRTDPAVTEAYLGGSLSSA